MSFTMGNKYKITLFGESHGKAVGTVIEGIPAGFEINSDKIKEFMARRVPGGCLSTKRNEKDEVEILSGIFNGKTCGTPVCGIIRNEDVNDADYEKIKNIPRPAHSDYPAFVKYQGFNDYRGGGAFSGRMTAPMCFAGGIAIQLLEKENIIIESKITELGGVEVTSDAEIADIIEEACDRDDSVGGKVKCRITGMPVGAGEPFFDGLESVISRLVFSIPGVKGIEFGETKFYGSENNDGYEIRDGVIVTKTNNHGGILGGLSSGMPIEFTCIVKPTPSIAIPQNSVDLKTKEGVELRVTGRHDPCILPRILPCIEAAAAIAIYDIL